jgi:Ni,Fe-hydrogenase III component G|tara:strand:- start:1523 stop:1753 length:231 start_codon:yes stop_codon:yes gene_type:complete
MTTSAPVEKVSQEEMLKQFKEQYAGFIKENQELSAKIKQNEVQALKLQGAIETLEYYSEGGEPETASHPPDSETEE